ncbi:MAG: YicC/YloC family endoribonuclease [Alphaproteobacteria bacterium]|nr:YicC/YloC family endoribonuclease [Alphaproteobacteria bacterium]
MTGFARAEGHADGYGWVCEAKSVNGRGLDVRCRLPSGFEPLEAVAREAALARFKRGNVTINMTVTPPSGRVNLTVNREVLDQLMELHAELGDRVDTGRPRLESLLAIRGVVEVGEPEEDEAARTARLKAMGKTVGKTLDALAKMRGQEGARLAETLSGQVADIEALAAEADAEAANLPELLRARVKEQVATLLEAETGLPEERLAQEVALLATKGDVREEVDRLKAHVAAARELLAEGGAIGRRLDFLCQEFNREANTIGSKSASIELTRIGLRLKSVIDQFREQAQNIE